MKIEFWTDQTQTNNSFYVFRVDSSRLSSYFLDLIILSLSIAMKIEGIYLPKVYLDGLAKWKEIHPTSSKPCCKKVFIFGDGETNQQHF